MNYEININYSACDAHVQLQQFFAGFQLSHLPLPWAIKYGRQCQASTTGQPWH
jgi:hypothetical protein